MTTQVPDEEPWAKAKSELDSGRVQASLWARALAQADGDQSRATTYYIRDRARQLIAEANLGSQNGDSNQLADVWYPTPTSPKVSGSRKSASGCGPSVIIVAGVLGILLWVNSNDDSSADAVPALNACERHVEDRLKSPSSADFAGYGEWQFTKTDAGYVIRSHVDAQNSFGATMRNNFVCDVVYKNGDWYVENLELNQP